MATNVAHPNLAAIAIPFAIIAWSVFRRLRRSIGRQPMQPKTFVTRVVVFAVVGLLMAVVYALQPKMLLGYGGGLLLGVPIGLAGLRLTRFEHTPQGQFYTPNTYLGVGVSLLLVGRLAYRMVVIYAAPNLANPSAPAALQSPLTLFLFGLLAGYYITYFSGLLIRSRQETLAATPPVLPPSLSK